MKMKRAGPIGRCCWKKYSKDGPWRPVLCLLASSECLSMLSQRERALEELEKKNKQIKRLKSKIEELKR